jgi:hypothetical protein
MPFDEDPGCCGELCHHTRPPSHLLACRSPPWSWGDTGPPAIVAPEPIWSGGGPIAGEAAGQVVGRGAKTLVCLRIGSAAVNTFLGTRPGRRWSRWARA